MPESMDLTVENLAISRHQADSAPDDRSPEVRVRRIPTRLSSHKCEQITQSETSNQICGLAVHLGIKVST
jgi:hypothetical protein